MKNGSLSVVMLVFLLLSAIGLAEESKRKADEMPSPEVMEVVQPKGTCVVIDKTHQVLYCFVNGAIRLQSECGTGVGLSDASTTHKGSFKIMHKGGANFKSTKYHGAPMPYPMQFTEDGDFIHGSYSFLTMPGKDEKKQGFLQSHGCVRLPVPVAKELSSLVEEGTPVHVVGDDLASITALGLDPLLEHVPGNSEKFRLKIASEHPSKKDVALARKMFLEKKMFIKPKGEKDRSKCVVGYPFLPPEMAIPLPKFESLILSPEEQAQGIHIKLD